MPGILLQDFYLMECAENLAWQRRDFIRVEPSGVLWRIARTMTPEAAPGAAESNPALARAQASSLPSHPVISRASPE